MAGADCLEAATRMRGPVLSAVLWLGLGLALGLWPPAGRAQSYRDFVFTDLQGHLVLRFAGLGPSGLDPSQADEFLDSEFSTMVHDHLRADLLFEAEPQDPKWAAAIEPRIEQHVKQAGPAFSRVVVECRADSCRVTMEQPGHWSLQDHLAVLDTVQKSVEAFIAAHPQDFERAFMITAYDKQYETAHIKAFLRRAGRTVPDRVDR